MQDELDNITSPSRESNSCLPFRVGAAVTIPSRWRRTLQLGVSAGNHVQRIRFKMKATSRGPKVAPGSALTFKALHGVSSVLSGVEVESPQSSQGGTRRKQTGSGVQA